MVISVTFNKYCYMLKMTPRFLGGQPKFEVTFDEIDRGDQD